MTVRREIPIKDGLFFITFTCHNWLHLFEEADAYHLIYKQFDFLQSKGHSVVGYVIMPNHFHALIHFTDVGKTINSIIGNIKRFLAYDIVEALTNMKKRHLLETLQTGVSKTDKKRGKLHNVFEPSFDCKYCTGEDFIRQKLNYIHNNPVRGKWQLAPTAVEYIHSSAKYYQLGVQGVYEVTWYKSLGE